MSARLDVHQHLWPEPLLSQLSRRASAPLLRRSGDGWTLRLDGEPDWPVDPADHDPVRRAALRERDGIDLALVALSSPLGIEELPADEAEPLIAAYDAGVAELPAGLRAWAAAGLAQPDADLLAARLDAGRVGLCLPAGALADPASAHAVAPLLDVLEGRSAALLVHPGPAPASPGGPEARPVWWPALTDYVSQMQAAWLGFREWVRPRHPRLRVCFAMLAGLAPLHHERLAARGGGPDPRDPLAFYDTSSYGPEAVAAMAATVGADALVHGSDRPVIAPPPAGAPSDPVRTANPARLLALQEVRT